MQMYILLTKMLENESKENKYEDANMESDRDLG